MKLTQQEAEILLDHYKNRIEIMEDAVMNEVNDYSFEEDDNYFLYENDVIDKTIDLVKKDRNDELKYSYQRIEELKSFIDE